MAGVLEHLTKPVDQLNQTLQQENNKKSHRENLGVIFYKLFYDL
jgi:hypothetical protein